jgi:hypothetical protein
MGGLGEEIEVEIGNAAHRAGIAMIPPYKWEKAHREGFLWFAPISDTIPNVQLIGVGRLRYRPRTSRTQAWYGELTANAPVWIERYRELLANAEKSAAKTA